ncbi:MAG: hypothetical protein IJ567_04440 [Lachnospiraceae bacterium]|nr:hypothetical protein [Lachnospiraceae bacterium]
MSKETKEEKFNKHHPIFATLLVTVIGGIIVFHYSEVRKKPEAENLSAEETMEQAALQQESEREKYADGLEGLLPTLEPQISEVNCNVKTQIYSGPGSDYWYREGMYTVSGAEHGLKVYGFSNEWIMVDAYSEYDQHYHIGWVNRAAIEDQYLFELEQIDFSPINLITTAVIFCTDEPTDGQSVIMQIPAKYTLQGLALFDEDWVYCQCTVDGGMPIRMFVPREKLALLLVYKEKNF